MSISISPFSLLQQNKNTKIKNKASKTSNELLEYEVLDEMSNSKSSIISDDINTKNPSNFLGTFVQNVYNVTNVLKFNIIPTENKFNFTQTDSIHILDTKYTNTIGGIKELLKEEVNKFIWFSYRSNFKEMVYNNKIYSSDAGWGCMIRVGQMILAKGIFQLFRINSFDEFCNDKLYLFLDHSTNHKNISKSRIMPNDYTDLLPNDSLNNDNTINDNKKIFPYYSIREICKIYPFISKGPGQWYSNYDLIAIIQCITAKYNPLSGAKIINFSEGTMYIQDIIDECFEKVYCHCCALSFEQLLPITSREEIDSYVILEIPKCIKTICQCFKDSYFYSGSYYILKHKFIMFISVRHGLYDLEEEYIQSILDFYDIKHNIGIIGGKNKRALYFIGYNKTELICLDPHFVQNTCDLDSLLSGNGKETYKPSYFTVNISQISPSFSLGIFCKNINDFQELIDQTVQHSQLKNSLFSIKNEKK